MVKGREFYNILIKSWFQTTDIEMYSKGNEQKPVDTERFTRTLKNKFYKYMTSVSISLYIDKLVDIIKK